MWSRGWMRGCHQPPVWAPLPVSGDVQGMARGGEGWKRSGVLDVWQRCCFGHAQAALSTPTPGRDERGASERSAPSDACVEAASSTRAAPNPANPAEEA